mmetsp:Transcript_3864/g.8625  ORF Transcript_3864/g.8625 Transcript_3864/m.8625 type:complete len:94 (-) Transcript_3864:2992-3273(-)
MLSADTRDTSPNAEHNVNVVNFILNNMLLHYILSILHGSSNLHDIYRQSAAPEMPNPTTTMIDDIVQDTTSHTRRRLLVTSLYVGIGRDLFVT